MPDSRQTFTGLLNEYMQGTTAKYLVQQCTVRGLKISESALSLARNGKEPPPGNPDLLTAIAELCERDPGPLLFLAQAERNGGPIVQAILNALDPTARYVPTSLDDLVNTIRGLGIQVQPPRERTLTVEVKLDGHPVGSATFPVQLST